MKYRKLGNTQLQLSAVGFGLWTGSTGWRGAEALGHVRDKMVIATKFGYDFYSHQGERKGQRELPQDFSPAFVRRACEESLRRLNTDYVDLYQLHNPRMPAIESDELFDTLEELKRQGQVRHYGAALGPAIGWPEEDV